MRPTLLAVVFSISFFGSAIAQEVMEETEAGASVFQYPSRGVLGILDPSKISVSNQVTFGYSSGGGSFPGGSFGMYQNRLSYQISDPLRVTLLLGYQFASPYDDAMGGLSQRDRIFPGLSISYVPNENFAFQFQYRQVPAYSLYDPFDPWSSPWARGLRPGR